MIAFVQGKVKHLLNVIIKCCMREQFKFDRIISATVYLIKFRCTTLLQEEEATVKFAHESLKTPGA